MTSAITASEIRAALHKHADPRQASILQRFFKTGPGEYGEGDIFIGVKVPLARSVARAFRSAPLKAVKALLKSPIHEERLLALLLLIEQYDKGDEEQRTTIFNFYLRQTKYINNWDLVDISAPRIVGRHLEARDRSILVSLSKSKSLWERRIGIMATFWFIKKGYFADAFMISEILLKDRNDLIHKAVGWMLRETGKRNITAAEEFLKRYYKDMPRTMLRYAIERFHETKRQAYLKGAI
jgi:3-methyladenine DNA glycosylase AlkD